MSIVQGEKPIINRPLLYPTGDQPRINRAVSQRTYFLPVDPWIQGMVNRAYVCDPFTDAH